MDKKDLYITKQFNEDNIFMTIVHRPTNTKVYDYGSNEVSLKRRLLQRLQENIND